MSRTDMMTTKRSSILRYCPAAVEFFRSRRGLAAVEFAILLPLMLMLYLGSFEISQAVSLQRQVALTASTVANIVTQYASISQSNDIPDILQASVTVLTPHPVSSAVVTVSCITIDKSGNGTVAWSQSLNGSPRKVGQAVALPAGLAVPNTSVVLGETSYAYAPLMDLLHMGTLNLYSSVFMLPRSSSGMINLTP
jgi:Flp pilus assembly protein TadG